jgi:hypothetical protein
MEIHSILTSDNSDGLAVLDVQVDCPTARHLVQFMAAIYQQPTDHPLFLAVTARVMNVLVSRTRTSEAHVHFFLDHTIIS